MESAENHPDKTVAALIHLSTFTQFFFPFGNFIFPLLLWMAKRDDKFVDEHGKQALNFQISLFLYLIFLTLIGTAGILLIGINTLGDSFPFDYHYNSIQDFSEAIPLITYSLVMVILFFALFILNLYAVISATLRAGEGAYYQYPLTINFIKPAKVGINQSKNEQFNNTQNQTL